MRFSNWVARFNGAGFWNVTRESLAPTFRTAPEARRWIEDQQEAERQAWLVAYTVGEQPYAVAFSTRALADAFLDSIEGDGNSIDTFVDEHTPEVPESDPKADRGDWEFHQSHDQ